MAYRIANQRMIYFKWYGIWYISNGRFYINTKMTAFIKRKTIAGWEPMNHELDKTKSLSSYLMKDNHAGEAKEDWKRVDFKSEICICNSVAVNFRF